MALAKSLNKTPWRFSSKLSRQWRSQASSEPSCAACGSGEGLSKMCGSRTHHQPLRGHHKHHLIGPVCPATTGDSFETPSRWERKNPLPRFQGLGSVRQKPGRGATCGFFPQKGSQESRHEPLLAGGSVISPTFFFQIEPCVRKQQVLAFRQHLQNCKISL